MNWNVEVCSDEHSLSGEISEVLKRWNGHSVESFLVWLSETALGKGAR